MQALKGQVLQLDIQGYPQRWVSTERAAEYYATESVVWTVGELFARLRGGVNAQSGILSAIDVHPIIAIAGASKANLFDAVPSLTNPKLFKRDHWTCAYCSSHHPGGVGLTREHIIPQGGGRGGQDVWTNVVSACKNCNHRKNCRTPEEAGMPLLFAPYTPSVFEDFLLRGRGIRGDVHEWLASRVSKSSRWYNV